MLEIDLKIIIVQIVTFLIGVFVLWKISWKPLMEILFKRKNDIARNIADSEKLKQETESLKVKYETMTEDLNKKAQELLAQATSSAEIQKQQIIDAAQNETKKIIESAKKQIENEREAVKTSLREEIMPIAISISEKILEKTIDKNTQNQLIEKFLNEIPDIKEN